MSLRRSDPLEEVFARSHRSNLRFCQPAHGEKSHLYDLLKNVSDNIDKADVSGGDGINNNESVEVAGSGLTPFEIQTNKMRISGDNPMTYGEYRKVESDPNHPIRDPDNPRHDEYISAKAQMQEMRKNPVPLASSTLSLDGLSLDRTMFQNMLKTPYVEGVFKAASGIDTGKYFDAGKVSNAYQACEGLNGRMPFKEMIFPKISGAEFTGLKSVAEGIIADGEERLGFSDNEESVADNAAKQVDISNLLPDSLTFENESWARELEGIQESQSWQMEEIQQAAIKKAEEEQLFRERLEFGLSRIAELQEEHAAIDEKNRQADLTAQNKRDKIEKSRFWWTIVVGLLTLFATIAGLILALI